MNGTYAQIHIKDKVLNLTYEEFADLGQCYDNLAHIAKQDTRVGVATILFQKTIFPVSADKTDTNQYLRGNKFANTALTSKHAETTDAPFNSEIPKDECPHGFKITDTRYPGLAGNCSLCRGQIRGQVG